MSITLLRWIMWLMTLFLCAVGLIMVASTTSGLSAEGEGPTLGFLTRQGVAMAIGVVAAVALSAMGTSWLRRNGLVMALLVGTALVLAVTPHIGVMRNHATRWIDLGPVLVQPAEFAKLSLIICTAWYLVRVEERVRVNWYGVLLPMLAFAVLAVLVYRTRDLGSIVVMAGVLWIMLFYAGANWLYTTVLGIGCSPLVLYLTVFETAYRRDRVLAFLDPMNVDNPAGYHLRQSLIAIATGGLWGVGTGEGPSRNAFLPERHTDFIFAAICEELGFVGGVSVGAACLLLVVVGLLIAARTPDRHRRLLAVGAVVLIGIQAFWNMLVATGTLPTKGLTLPFVSYGGSSLVVSLMAIGLLDAVARNCPASEPHRRRVSSRIGAAVVRPTRRSDTEGAW